MLEQEYDPEITKTNYSMVTKTFMHSRVVSLDISGFYKGNLGKKDSLKQVLLNSAGKLSV